MAAGVLSRAFSPPMLGVQSGMFHISMETMPVSGCSRVTAEALGALALVPLGPFGQRDGSVGPAGLSGRGLYCRQYRRSP